MAARSPFRSRNILLGAALIVAVTPFVVLLLTRHSGAPVLTPRATTGAGPATVAPSPALSAASPSDAPSEAARPSSPQDLPPAQPASPGEPGAAKTVSRSDVERSLSAPSPVAQVQPFVPPLWDGAFVATQRLGTFSSPEVLDREQQTWVKWAVRNVSTEEASGPYNVSLRLDGESLATWERPGLKAGGIDVVLDWPLVWRESHRFTGPHRFTLEVRGAGAAGQPLAPQAVSREFVWGQTTPQAAPTPRFYTAAQLRERIGRVKELLASDEAVSASPRGAQDVLDIADAVYYALYLRSMYDEPNAPLAVHLLNRADYPMWVKVECTDRAERLGGGSGKIFGELCGQLAGAAGYYSKWEHQNRIVLRSDRTAAEVLLNLAHELGHFRQSVQRPDLDAKDASLNLSALREAQAYVHEVEFLRAIELVLGHPLLLYPRDEKFEHGVEQGLAGFVAKKDTSEHARGRLLLWVAVLDDPRLATQGAELRRNGYLTWQSARTVYAYLMAIAVKDVDAYVNGKIDKVDASLPTIRSVSKGRLVNGLTDAQVGASEFQEVGLLSP